MNRILRIVIYAVVMFLVFLWVSSIYKSCNAEDTASSSEIIQENDSADTGLDDLFEDDTSFEVEGEDALLEEDEPSVVGEEDILSTSMENEGIESSESVQEESSASSESSFESSIQYEEETNNSTASSNSIQSSGKYLVIAGSYLIKSNADSMVGKLKRMGFNNAEIVQFDFSQYHSICAGRYKSNSSAQSIVKQLKSQGIDSYVHIKQ